MDPNAIAGMIFTLIALVLIGGFILLVPLSRQLAQLMQQRLERGETADQDARIASLARAVESLSEEVGRLAERQEFTERLLERPRAEKDDTR
jgi:predicted PurR-regulated permease PerM